MADSDDIELIHGVGPSRAEELRELGLNTFEAIAEAEPSVLAEVTGIGIEMAIELRHSAARLRGDASGDDPDGARLDFGNPHEVGIQFDSVESLTVHLDQDETKPVPPVEAPLARFRTEPASLKAGEEVRFNASPTIGEIDTYAWDFNFDGGFTPSIETSSPVTATTFDQAGDREIALAVTDVDGRTDRIIRSVDVDLPEAQTIVSFPLEEDQEQRRGLLFRFTGDNQSFRGESSLPSETEVLVLLTDYPGGVSFRSNRVNVGDDGQVRTDFNLSQLDHGTYFIEVRDDESVLGRRKVAVREPPAIE